MENSKTTVKFNKNVAEKPKNSISLNKNIMKKIKIIKGDYDSNGDISSSQNQNSSYKFIKKVGTSQFGDNLTKDKSKKFTFDNVFNKKTTTNNSYLTNSHLISIPAKNTVNTANPGNSIISGNIIPSNLNNINSITSNVNAPVSGHQQINININNFNFNHYNVNSTTKNKNSNNGNIVF